jgi:hypothetical protein
MDWYAVVGRGWELHAIARFTELAGDDRRARETAGLPRTPHVSGRAVTGRRTKAQEPFQNGFKIQCIESTLLGNTWFQRRHCQRDGQAMAVPDWGALPRACR